MQFRFAAGAVLGLALLQAGPPSSAQGTAAPQQPPAQAQTITGVVLQGLDKLVARVHEIEAPLDEAVELGTLRILVRHCAMAPPESPPESSAFLEIVEQRPGEEARKVFSGWMFASSPALSALEHPIYDVWVVRCRTMETASPASTR